MVPGSRGAWPQLVLGRSRDPGAVGPGCWLGPGRAGAFGIPGAGAGAGAGANRRTALSREPRQRGGEGERVRCADRSTPRQGYESRSGAEPGPTRRPTARRPRPRCPGTGPQCVETGLCCNWIELGSGRLGTGCARSTCQGWLRLRPRSVGAGLRLKPRSVRTGPCLKPSSARTVLSHGVAVHAGRAAPRRRVGLMRDRSVRGTGCIESGSCQVPASGLLCA